MKKTLATLLIVVLALFAFGFWQKASADRGEGGDNGLGNQNSEDNQAGMMQGQEDQGQSLGNVPGFSQMPNFVGDFNRFKDFKSGDFENEDNANWPSSVSINPQGEVRLTNAAVNSVNAPNLNVSVWGFSFNVVTDSSTRLTDRNSQPVNLSDIKTGDTVDVLGQVSNPGTVNASIVRDRSLGQAPQSLNQGQVQGFVNFLVNLIERLTGKPFSLPSAPTSTSSST